MAKSDNSAFMSVDEGHALIGKQNISRRSLYNALEREEIPSVRLGRRLLIPRHSFIRWLEECGGLRALNASNGPALARRAVR